jgi:small ligand-binding sensory domain FIST
LGIYVTDGLYVVNCAICLTFDRGLGNRWLLGGSSAGCVVRRALWGISSETLIRPACRPIGKYIRVDEAFSDIWENGSETDTLHEIFEIFQTQPALLL